MTPRGLNMKEFGELYGKSRWEVQKWIRQGMPFVPLGKKHKMILVDVGDRWLRSRLTTVRGRR